MASLFGGGVPVVKQIVGLWAVLVTIGIVGLAFRRFGVTLIGLFTAADEDRQELEDLDLDVLLNPARSARRPDPGYAYDGEGRIRRPAVRGLIGVALRWEDLRRLARLLIESPAAGSGRPGATHEQPGQPGLRDPRRRPRSAGGLEGRG